MKLAIAGKGGSGKTTITGTLARVLAQDGRRVLCIDDDTNPNLAVTLGMGGGRLPTIDQRFLAAEDGCVWLTHTVDAICVSHGSTGPDGIRLLITAHPLESGTGCLSMLHATMRTIIREAPNGPQDVLLLDTEPTLEHFARRTTMHIESLLCVVEPYFKSLETGRRMASLAAELELPHIALLANKIRDEDDLARVEDFAASHDLELFAAIPYDDALPAAERAERAPFDAVPDSPAVQAIAELAQRALSRAEAGLPAA